MGQIRIDTIAKVLTSPPEQEEEILSKYASEKATKHELYQALGLQESGDVFEPAGEIKQNVRAQVAFARELAQPQTREIQDKSEIGVARTSEAFRKILTLAKKIDEDAEPLQRIELFSRAASFLFSDTVEPAIKNLAIATLSDEFKDDLVGADRTAQQIAVAISLRFNGTPTDPKHREQIAEFVDQHFVGEASELGEAIKRMLQEPHSSETTRLFNEKRAFRI